MIAVVKKQTKKKVQRPKAKRRTVAHNSFRPDWMVTWTAAVAEARLSGKHFRFQGPGWYQVGPDTVLVLAFQRPVERWWNKLTVTEGEVFQFNWYSSRNPADTFNAIVNAPTRGM